MHRLHLIGSGPRTGTSLLQAAMQSCFEFNVVSQIERSVLWNPRTVKGGCVLSKDPTGFRKAGLFLKADPSLCVLAVIRDPRDMVVSVHKINPSGYFCGMGYWKEFVRFYKSFQDHPRVLAIRYEKMVKDPDAVQETIMQRFSFLEKKQAFSRYHQADVDLSEQMTTAMNGINAMSTKSIGRWRQHLPRVAGQLELHGDISQDLIDFGYETDDSWLKELEGVEPDLRGDIMEAESKNGLRDCLRYSREVLRVLQRRCHLDVTPIRGASEREVL